MPNTRPQAFVSGPPELPCEIAAEWTMASSVAFIFCSAFTTPVVMNRGNFPGSSEFSDWCRSAKSSIASPGKPAAITDSNCKEPSWF